MEEQYLEKSEEENKKCSDSPQVQARIEWGTSGPHYYVLYLKVVGAIK